MKLLLVAFLLAIVSLQAAAVAVGDYATATIQMQHKAAADIAEEAEADAEALKASATIEELSDYLPAVLPVPRVTIAPFPSHPAELVFRSIYLPRIKPPPRG